MTNETRRSTLSIRPGALAAAVDGASRTLHERGFFRALDARDPSAWSADSAVQRVIANRLGWLDAPDRMKEHLGKVEAFARSIREEGFSDVVLLGMGGSSLAPEVLRAVIGVQPGWPRFTMVDSVNADHVHGIAADPRTTLFVLASKSGTTIEPNVLAAYFRQRLLDANVLDWSRHFIAVTDPGTALDERARREGFREVFRNPPDIGGRYSALSLFGLVPAALMGIDVRALVEDARRLLALATDEEGPAAPLGALIGAAASRGRDKLTLLLPPVLEPLGLWIEQLVAESTGKDGTGVLPVAGEPVGRPESYGDDRVFVHVRVTGSSDRATEELVQALEGSDAPIATIDVGGPSSLGAEFIRWEVATVTAGALLGINPFDEPNVKQAKDATRALLDSFAREGRLPVPEPDAEIDHAAFTLTSAARRALASADVPADGLLSLLAPGDYLAILAYLPARPDTEAAVGAFRAAVRQRTRCATTFGYGPRYLHSTGQLHKGGANNGVFLMLTAPGQDLAVPGEPFGFGVLELAQALGDLASLEQAGRRALHVHLPRPDAVAVQRCFELLLEE